MPIRIEIPSVDYQTRKKKPENGGGVFYLQEAWVHTTDRDGKLQQYPQRIDLFVDVDDSGKPMPYPQGDYKPHPSSFYVKQGRLNMFLRLQPIKASS